MIVIYHDNCFDGFTAAWVAHMKHPDARLVPALYGKPLPDIYPQSAGETVVMVDISWPRRDMARYARELEDSGSYLVVLDHHKTAQAELDGFRGPNVTVTFDLDKSGARLAWDYFNPLASAAQRPPLVDYIEDRDLWRFQLPGSREINAFIQAHERTLENWTLLNAVLLSQTQQALMMGKAIQASNATYCAQMVAQARIYEIHGYEVPVVNASVLFSEVANALLEAYPEAKFAAYYFNRGDGVQQWGLRSRKDFDCSVIAKKEGGGGHPQAAGFNLDADLEIPFYVC